jgi:hypothetical protein
MKSEPLWCDVRQQYCRCHDYGKRCDDFDEVNEPAIKVIEELTSDKPHPPSTRTSK